MRFFLYISFVTKRNYLLKRKRFFCLKKKQSMELKHVFWQDETWWVGYLDEYPDYKLMV